MFIPLLAAVQYLQELETPGLKRIVVESAAVWFVSSEWRVNPLAAAYVYDKATGRWRRAPAAAGPPVTLVWPERNEDRVALAPSYNLMLNSGPDGGGPVIMSRSDNRTYILPREMTSDDRRWLRSEDPTLADIPVGGFSGVWTRVKDDVWFARGRGGAEEGSAGLGGVLHLDLKTGRMESLRSRYLLRATASGLAVTGGALWIGTLGTGDDYGPAPDVGLLRYDLTTHQCQPYTANGSDLPGEAIHTVAADGDRLWVTTEEGIAVLDTRSRAWTVWSFATALSGDTIVHELIPGKQPSTRARRTLFALMLLLKIADRQAFLSAWLTTDTLLFGERAHWGIDSAAVGLAQAPMVPFLVPALSRPGSERSLAAIALLEAWPHLVRMLERNQGTYELATTTLIQLTGVDSVPAPPVADSIGRARASAFWRQWFTERARSGRLRAVPPEDGDKAVERWQRRRTGANPTH